MESNNFRVILLFTVQRAFIRMVLKG